MYQLDRDQVLRVSEFESFSWLEHGFGTKQSADWPGTVDRATLKQIHSTQVAVAGRRGELGEGDALVTDRPGLFVAVKTADCIPVLLVDPQHRAVAAIHAGWRGTAGNIVSSTIDTLVSEFHTDPNELWAAIGPGIRKCCYQVSGEVARRFSAWLPDQREAPDGAMLDLSEVNRRQLIGAGVKAGHVLGAVSSQWCSRCEEHLLHSFRRDGERAGRMYSAIRVRPSD